MKITRVILSLFLVFCVVFTIIQGGYKNTNKIQNQEYKCILTVWHIDTFSGGVGSRKKFLLSVSNGFEKANTGVILSIIDRKIENVVEDFSKGIYPDLISFGNGLCVEPTKNIKTDKKYFTCDESGKVKSVPWCAGCYFLIKNLEFNSKKHSENSLVVSKNKYNQPLLCIKDEIDNFSKIDLLDSDKAFVSFYYGEYQYLLGTQRDIVKLENLHKTYQYEVITSFNDLYQYIAILSKQSDKQVYAEKFINYLLSSEVQRKIINLKMFSCFYKNEYDISSLDKVDILSIESGLYYNLSEKESSELSNLAEDCLINKTKEKNVINNLSFLLKKN